MTSVYGLPRYVGTFLRHMEAYKDLLKWNITEGSQKISLTLSWNFHHYQPHPAPACEPADSAPTGSAPSKSSLWERLQRTLRLPSGQPTCDGHLPAELTRFLDATLQRRSRSPSLLRRHLSLPFRRPRPSPSKAPPSPAMIKRPSLLRSRSNPLTNHVADHPPIHNGGCLPSPSRGQHYSWPGTPRTRPIVNHALPSPARPTSRQETTEETVARGEGSARRESVASRWEALCLDEGQASVKLDSWTDVDLTGSLPDISETVQRCLSSCDKILSKGVTEV